MNDPFSKCLRRYLPWSESEKFHVALEKHTLIGVSQWDTEQARERIKELEKIEDESGFVFVGEKQWLIDACESPNPVTYEEWVYRQMNDVVFPNGMERLQPSTQWHGYTEDLFFYVTFPQLEQHAATIDCLSLTVPGSETGPTAGLLVDAFQLIHDLSYTLWNTGRGFSAEYSLDEVKWSEEHGSWEIELISEYGAVVGFVLEKDGRWTLGGGNE